MSDIAPDRFIDNVFAYQRTAAVRAAIELDLFSAIGAGADSVETLAAKVDASPRASDVGAVRRGDAVNVAVEGIPDRVFHGTVSQIRRSPENVQATAAYSAVVSIDNEPSKRVAVATISATPVAVTDEDSGLPALKFVLKI